jgi:hypothetical protein
MAAFLVQPGQAIEYDSANLVMILFADAVKQPFPP